MTHIKKEEGSLSGEREVAISIARARRTDMRNLPYEGMIAASAIVEEDGSTPRFLPCAFKPSMRGKGERRKARRRTPPHKIAFASTPYTPRWTRDLLFQKAKRVIPMSRSEGGG